MVRAIFGQLQKQLGKKEFIIVTGARQIGKTTLLKHLQSSCMAQNIPTLFFNLEQKRFLADFDTDPLNLLKYLPETDQRVIIFIDEVQYLQDPSNFMKLLFDGYAHQLQLVVTGSSAFYIDDAFRDSLAGRKKLYQLCTFSFEEYLALTNQNNLLNDVKQLIKKPKSKSVHLALLKNEWEKYAIYGGYPAVILQETSSEKIEKLREIRDSFVKRDMLESAVGNENAFYHLLRVLAAQVGNMVNVNELSITLKIKNDTVNNYLWILQKCFHIALIKPYSTNLRKELTKMPKVYLMDCGLRNAMLNNFDGLHIREDKGSLFENMFFRSLRERYNWDNIHYWRTADGNELDFVIDEVTHQLGFEVKYDSATIKPSKYKKFTSLYPNIPIHFISFEPFSESFFRQFNTYE